MWHALKSAGTLDDRIQRGLDARNRVPHDAHADLYRSQVRPDPLRLVLEQDQGRLPSLIPCGASGCPPTCTSTSAAATW